MTTDPVTSPAPLTEAERAAAEALAVWHNAHSSTSRLAVAAFEGEARTVVAAVRGPIYREAAAEIRKDWPKSPFVAQKLEKLAETAEGHGDDWSDWQDGDDGPSCKCGFNGSPQECASSRNLARQSLSLPASKETQQ